MDAERSYNNIICLLAGVSDPLRAPYALEEKTRGFFPKDKIRVVLWAGPSGVGKGEMAKELEKAGVGRIPRDATREKRPNEIHGKDYFFRTVDEFQEMISRGSFLWWTQAGLGGYRGLSREAINFVLASHRAAYIDAGGESAIDLPKIPQLRAYGLATVMILPPSFQELRERMQGRFAADNMADRAEEMQKRLSLAEKLLEKTADAVDIYLVNDRMEDIPKKVSALFKALNLS